MRKKSEGTAKVRERLVAGYKSRVTSFIKEMTVQPVNETDYYGKGFKQMEHHDKMVGHQRMKFGAAFGDDERVNTAINKNSPLDSNPTDPEWKVWSMRPRQKSKEIGPAMRFNDHS